MVTDSNNVHNTPVLPFSSARCPIFDGDTFYSDLQLVQLHTASNHFPTNVRNPCNSSVCD
jgi:hypothetical protein